MSSTQTSVEFVRSHIAAHGWASPTTLTKAMTPQGVKFSRQALMVALDRLVKEGTISRLGRGFYAVPDFQTSDRLKALVRNFILSNSLPRTKRVPSKMVRGQWEDFDEWRPHTPSSLAAEYLLQNQEELPKQVFATELAAMVEEGLMQPADLGPQIQGQYYWASAKGRALAAMLA